MKHHDYIDQSIAQWTSQLGKFEVMERVQGAGVPAGAVFDSRDTNLNPHYKARGFLEVVDYPEERQMGKRVLMGRPWRLSKTPLSIKEPAPTLGQHNREVLQDILGYSEARYQELEQAGIISNKPITLRSRVHVPIDERIKQGRLAYHDPQFKEKLGI
jgi:crotonobetainyl-CoA:carnitine CoA-transferase CaiB-like acyl-CoA transferase